MGAVRKTVIAERTIKMLVFDFEMAMLWDVNLTRDRIFLYFLFALYALYVVIQQDRLKLFGHV